jgi:hypothetical protein
MHQTEIFLMKQIEKYKTQVERVRELHKPEPIGDWFKCVECDPESCGCSPVIKWPCPTIQALDGEQ